MYQQLKNHSSAEYYFPKRFWSYDRFMTESKRAIKDWVHRARVTLGKRILREFSWADARWIAKRRNLLLAPWSPNHYWKMKDLYTTKGLHAPSSRWTKDQIQSDYLQMPVHWLTAPSGACQHPALLWYDTVDNQTVLQSDSEHLSRCSCLRHVLIGALVRKWTSVWGCHSIPINYC